MGRINRLFLALFDRSRTKGFDSIFYGQYYRDLSAFDEDRLFSHYRKHGQREGRARNVAEARAQLEAKHGKLPADFDREGYRSINKDLPGHFRFDWESDLHYIATGREEGRRYKVSSRKPRCRSIYVYRGDGLGTRLLTVIYAKILADMLGFQVKVVWGEMKSPYYGGRLFDPAKLSDIFADSHVFHDGDERDGEICAAIPHDIRILQLDCDLGKSTKVSLDSFLGRLDDENYNALFYGQPGPALSFMKHERDLCFEVGRVWKTVAWSTQISAFIERYCALESIENRIAVHVRRGDLVRMLLEADPNFSPEEMTGIFIRYASLELIMKQIDEVRSGEKLLVCSDDDRMVKRFKDEYGEADVCSSHDEERLTEDQKAVVDIVLLSRSKILVSPYLSLFSRCAAEVGSCGHVATPIDLGSAVEELIAIADRRADGCGEQVKACIYATAARLATDQAAAH
jgi:hypothetical protein